MHFILSKHFGKADKDCKLNRLLGSELTPFPRDSLVVCHWKDGVLSKIKLYNKLLKNFKCNCIGKRPLNADLQFLNLKVPKDKRCLKCIWTNRSLLVTLSLTLGFSEPNPEYIEIMDELLRCKQFIGGFIGSGSFAYYLIGMTTDKYVFLDPHFVQSPVSSIDDPDVSTYKVQSIKETLKRQISTCVSLGFLLHNNNDLSDFYEQLMVMKEKYNDNFYFAIQENDSKKDK